MESNSKWVGSLNELRCLIAFVELGCTVSFPYGDSAPYDFVADVNGKLYKIQAKAPENDTGRSFSIPFRRSNPRDLGNKARLYRENDVDFFSTYHNGKVYLVPWSGGTSRVSLSLEHRDARSHRSAGDYEIHKVLAELRESLGS